MTSVYWRSKAKAFSLMGKRQHNKGTSKGKSRSKWKNKYKTCFNCRKMRHIIADCYKLQNKMTSSLEDKLGRSL